MVLEGGERLPLLLDQDGVPLFRPAVWMMTMRRAVNMATATLKEDLQALKVLYCWDLRTGKNIEDRMLAGKFLSATECASLVDAMRRPVSELGGALELGRRAEPIKNRNLESYRMRHEIGGGEIGSATTATRLRTVIQYLRWLADEGIQGIDKTEAVGRTQSRDEMVSDLVARIPKGGRRNVLGNREAPPPEAMETLLRIVELDAPLNPWKDLGLKVRNRLLIHLLFGLGIRRGELLGIRIDRIDFHGNRLLIARCPDDPMDSRKYQPLTKTRDRWLPMKDGLVAMVQEYVTHVRSKFPKARKHPYLLVSHRDGAPLAMISVNKFFVSLRGKFADLPEDLSPHLLRHAWNDAFSRLADSQGMEPAREEQIRSEMMGWAPASGTAATYTRRHTREAAERMSLQHQEGLCGKEDK